MYSVNLSTPQVALFEFSISFPSPPILFISSINEDTKSDHETAENKKPRVPDTSDDDEDVPALSVTGGFEWEENDMTTGGRESSGEEAMNEDKVLWATLYM